MDALLKRKEQLEQQLNEVNEAIDAWKKEDEFVVNSTKIDDKVFLEITIPIEYLAYNTDTNEALLSISEDDFSEIGTKVMRQLAIHGDHIAQSLLLMMDSDS